MCCATQNFHYCFAFHDRWDKKPVSGTRKNLPLECSSAEMKAFFEKLDNLMIDMGVAHPEWFKKKKISRDAVDTFYRRCLQPSKGDYPPLVRVKVIEGESEMNDTIVREVYTPEGETEESYDIGDSYTIKPNTDLVAVLKVRNVWFVGGSFGLSITAEDILAWPPQKQVDSFPFQLPFNMKKRKRAVDDSEIDLKKLKGPNVIMPNDGDTTPFNGGLGDSPPPLVDDAED